MHSDKWPGNASADIQCQQSKPQPALVNLSWLQVNQRWEWGLWELRPNSSRVSNLSSSGNLSHFHYFSQDFSIPAISSWPKWNVVFKVRMHYITDLSFFSLLCLVKIKKLQSWSKVVVASKVAVAVSSSSMLSTNMACENQGKARKGKARQGKHST